MKFEADDDGFEICTATLRGWRILHCQSEVGWSSDLGAGDGIS